MLTALVLLAAMAAVVFLVNRVLDPWPDPP